MDDISKSDSKARLGIAGLDDILLGGLARNRVFLLEGTPGTGKTTLALQSLLEGARCGESLLYSSDLELGETTKRLFEAVERSKPRRIVLDSLSEIRLLAQSSLRYSPSDIGPEAIFCAARCDGHLARRYDGRD